MRLRHELRLGGSRGGGKRVPYEAETQAYIDAVLALPTPGDVRYRNQLNTFVKTLKDNSLWAKFDRLYLANFEDIGSRVSLVNPSFVAAKLNTVAFTDKYGWSVADAGCGLDMNVNLASGNANSATKYVSGSGCYGMYFWDNWTLNDDAIFIFGSRTDLNTNSNTMAKSSLETYRRKIQFQAYQSISDIAKRPVNNNNDADTVTVAGLLAVSRSTNVTNFMRLNKNAINGNNEGYNSARVFNGNVYSFTVNNNGTAQSANLVGYKCPVHFVAGYMTNTELGIFETAIETYLGSVGAAK